MSVRLCQAARESLETFAQRDAAEGDVCGVLVGVLSTDGDAGMHDVTAAVTPHPVAATAAGVPRIRCMTLCA